MSMNDYEYYKDEMNKGTVPVIKGTSAHSDFLYLGKLLAWLPKKIFRLFRKKKDQ